MTKVTDQDIPPEQAANFNRLFAKTRSRGAAGSSSTIKPKARTPGKTSPRNEEFQVLVAACAYITNLVGFRKDSQNWRDFRAQLIENVQKGIFEPLYWKEQIQIDNAYLTGTPTVTDDDRSDSYAYHRPDWIKTKNTYTTGTISSGPMDHTAALDGIEFKDTQLTWRRIVFQLSPPIKRASPTPLVYLLNLTIHAIATTRGSRPMFSILTRTFLVDETDPALSTNVPPIKTTRSFYWRYYPPPRSGGGYAAAAERYILGTIFERFPKPIDETFNRLVMLVSPRPMLGHGGNNNAAVSVTVDSEQLI